MIAIHGLITVTVTNRLVVSTPQELDLRPWSAHIPGFAENLADPTDDTNLGRFASHAANDVFIYRASQNFPAGLCRCRNLTLH